MERLERIKAKIEESAKARAQTKEPSKEMRREGVQLLFACINVFQNPDNPDQETHARTHMLQVAKVNATVAHILVNGGFKTVKKFPADFDTLEACKQCYLHLSSFVEDAQSALKKGNQRNIEDGSGEAWKDTFETCMSKHGQVPWYQEINQVMAENDVMDGVVLVARLRAEATKLAADAAKKRPIVQTGRALLSQERKWLY